MSILVTGGAGYLGSQLVEKLIQHEERVVVFDNLSRGTIENLSTFINNPRFRLITGEVSDKKTLSTALNSVELKSIIHLAAVPGLERCRKDAKRAIETNILGTHNILELGRRTNVEKFIFSSSGAVYGRPTKTPISEEHALIPTNLYGVTKLAGEKLVEAAHSNYHLDTTILRFGNIFGIGRFTYYETVIPKFVKQAYHDNTVTIYGDGSQGRDFVHIHDITDAILLALHASQKHECEIYNVGTGKPVSINTLVDIIRNIMRTRLGKELVTTHLPARKGEPVNPDYCYDVTKINKNLGFSAKWTIDQGINQILTYMTS